VSIFSVLESDFKKWYGEFATEFKKVFEETAAISTAALPIVQEISAIVGALPTSGVSLPAEVFSKLTQYVGLTQKDVTAVQTFTQQYANAPIPSVLHAVAAAVIKNLPVAARATVSQIDTAVQNAYSVSKLLIPPASAPAK
jgi:hypothetical protein